MTYDNELTLIKETYTTDKMRNQIPGDEIRRNILCSLKSSTRSEFYGAAVAGMKPSIVFIVHAYEYEGEKVVVFNDEKYVVIRDFQCGFEGLELICEKVIGCG